MSLSLIYGNESGEIFKITHLKIFEMLDIVIPVFNEEEILRKRESYFRSLKTKASLIFVDGGSSDQTVKVAQGYGRVVSSALGRGVQKNCGAQLALSDYLLFLHVDTQISLESVDEVMRELNNGTRTGCFTLRIDDHRWIFRIFEMIINLRAKCFGIADGDLGLFVTKSIFEMIGRFDPLPLMEDIVISKKIRRITKLKILSDSILASSRKWQQKGFGFTLVRYTLNFFYLWTRCIKKS